MFDDELKTLLRERAGDVDPAPGVPPELLRGARRRRAFTALAAGAAAVALVAGGVAGVRLASTPRPPVPGTVVTPTPTPPADSWPAVWPETTREDAEAAQAEADEGRLAWRLEVEAFVEAFGPQHLGWDRVFFDESLDVSEPDESGPLMLPIYTCDPLADGGCPQGGEHYRAVVTVERLLRRDRTGIWSVTRLEGPEPFRVPEPARPSAGRPATFVALQPGPGDGDPVGRLVLVDVETGEPVRTILDGVDLSEGFGDVVLSPDGATVYYGQGTSACTGDAYRVPVDGGERELVAEGATLATPSPDGSRLAYVRGAAAGCPGAGQELVVRDLASGDERRWELGYETGAGAYGVCALAWLPDSRKLAFSDCAEEQDVLRLLDTETDAGRPLTDARALGPEDRSLTIVGFHGPSGGLAVRSSCTLQSVAADECSEPPALVSIDPDDGSVLATLLELPVEVHEMRLDAAGRHLIYVVPGEDGYGADVFAWSGEGEPEQIAEGYRHPAWTGDA